MVVVCLAFAFCVAGGCAAAAAGAGAAGAGGSVCAVDTDAVLSDMHATPIRTAGRFALSDTKLVC